MPTITGELQCRVEVTSVTSSGSLGDLRQQIRVGTTANVLSFEVVAAKTIILAASTPQEIDLTGLVDDAGVKVFGKVQLFYVRSSSSTAGHKVAVGGGASNPWTAPFGGTTPTVEAHAGSPILLTRLLDDGWTVDGTHKTVKLDPGANSQSVVLIVGGQAP